MGFKVGIPTMKLKVVKSGGKNAIKSKEKNIGDMRSILGEAGTERWSASKTLDRSRSADNEHLGPFSSGQEAYDAIMEELARYNETRRAEGKRAARKDATVAFAMIVHPPAEVMNAMTPEDRARFFKDSYDTLLALNVLSEDNVRMRERHRDEGGEHEHIISMAYDADGNLNGKKVLSLTTFKKLNKEFPKLMRQKGWDVEECEVYDQEAVKSMTPEEADAYKAEHRAKKVKQGLSANEYIALKHAEEAEQRAVDAYDMVRQETDLERCSVHVDAQEVYDESIIEAYAEMEPKRKAVDKRMAEADAREKAAQESEARAKSLKNQVGYMTVDMKKIMYPDPEEYEKHRYHGTEEEIISSFGAFVSEQGEAAKQNVEQKRQNEIQAQANVREQERLAQLADDITAVSAEADSVPEKTGWMMRWIRQNAPRTYAAAQSAYEKYVKPVIDKVKNVQQRAHQRRTGFEDMVDAYEHRFDGDRGLGE